MSMNFVINILDFYLKTVHLLAYKLNSILSSEEDLLQEGSFAFDGI